MNLTLLLCLIFLALCNQDSRLILNLLMLVFAVVGVVSLIGDLA